jgi:SAM-dependent methyltransferase
MREYARSQEPIEVNFRELVDWIPYNSERATHLMHPYPAKLLLHIPHLFLANELLSAPGDVVLDPFCGTGRVLVEALLNGRNAEGIDANPLASLIAKVKSSPLSPVLLEVAGRELRKRIAATKRAEPPAVLNLEHWFFPHIVRQLAVIWSAIRATPQNDTRDFFAVTFSNCVRQASLADPRVGTPVRQNPKHFAADDRLRRIAADRLGRLRRLNVLALFEKLLAANIQRMGQLSARAGVNEAVVRTGDARRLPGLGRRKGPPPQARAQLIITSPPYAGAQKYVRSSALSLGWLELCRPEEVRRFKRRMIGRDDYQLDEYATLVPTGIPEADARLQEIYERSPLRAHVAANYLREMRLALGGSVALLKPGGYFVLIAANNQVGGAMFEMKNYLAGMLKELGLRRRFELVDAIKTRGLMTKRNKTAGLIARESVFLFQRAENGERRDQPHRSHCRLRHLFKWQRYAFARLRRDKGGVLGS